MPAIAGFWSSVLCQSTMTIISNSNTRVINGGRVVLTSGISDWISTGCKPYDNQPSPLDEEWRRHCIAVILTSHLGGDQLDTCDSDHELNRVAFDHPGEGHRVVNVWNRNSTGKIFAITDDYGGEDAVTTIMWAGEY